MYVSTHTDYEAKILFQILHRFKVEDGRGVGVVGVQRSDQFSVLNITSVESIAIKLKVEKF